jgi:signal transduction histidine kinase
MNIGKRETAKINDMIADYNGFGNPNVEAKKTLKESDNFTIFSLYDKQLDSSYIDLIGKIYVKSADSDDTSESDGSTSKKNSNNSGKSSSRNKTASLILIRSNLESITESVSIANKFLAYMGIIAAMIGTLAMFIISKKFTKPILDLAGIAKKMSDLDFEVKYNVKTKDEIGELGSSINALSDKLETTITELKQANNELTTDIQRKTEIDEMRKEFLSNVSHELKTPIALIQGYAEGLKENINEDEESRDFYCEVIMDEANKMNNMVKKLLSLNELEFGNNQVNFDRFDIVALIRSVLGTTEILFKQKEVTLHFEQTEPIYVWADELLIEQVVTNYISNALNHVNGQKIIEIKLIPREDTVRVAVFNTGDNIPQDELDKIWIKFYKVDKARTREYGGSGIGLSIVKAIMNSHNKECGVINRPIGVEFWFELDTKS